MFERFTETARDAVIEAQVQARALHHEEILAEHLLLAVLANQHSVGAQVLREGGAQPGPLAAEVARLGLADGDALREIGIDLGAVRERAEAAFGQGALDRPRPRQGGLLRRVAGTGGHLPFSAAAKLALVQSLRQARALHDDHISVDHLVLGLLADNQSAAARALQRLGVNAADVRGQVRRRLRPAA